MFAIGCSNGLIEIYSNRKSKERDELRLPNKDLAVQSIEWACDGHTISVLDNKSSWHYYILALNGEWVNINGSPMNKAD